MKLHTVIKSSVESKGSLGQRVEGDQIRIAWSCLDRCYRGDGNGDEPWRMGMKWKGIQNERGEPWITAGTWGNLCQRKVRKKAEWVMKHEGRSISS